MVGGCSLLKSISPIDPPNVLACLIPVARLAKTLGVIPGIVTTQRLWLDVIDFNGWRDETTCSTVSAQRFGI